MRYLGLPDGGMRGCHGASLFLCSGKAGPAASGGGRARVWRAHAPLAAFALALAYISYLPPAGKAQRRRARPAEDARQPSEA